MVERLEDRRLLSTNVLTFHNDLSRSGLNNTETVLTPTNVNPATFGKLFEYPVDGQIYAQPLVDTNITVPGKGVHDIVYVATEHDTVYAFDATTNIGGSAVPLWSRSFIDTANGVTPIPSPDTNSGDLQPEVGITGTPVIDPSTNTLFVVANTKEIKNGITTYYARIHALDLGSGAEKLGGPVTISAAVPGNGIGSVNGVVAFQALWENERPALTLSNGVLYIAFAAHGDQGPYHGWVLAYSASTLKQIGAFNVTPNGKGGGIWMSGSGLSVDYQGRLLVPTANGDFSGTTTGPEWGDSVLQLTPTSTGVKVTDSFTPFNQDYLKNSDQDLGSGGILLLPTQSGSHPHEGVFGGKEGRLYVVDLDDLGRYNTTSDSQIVQSITGQVTRVFCALAYFNGRVYVHGTGNPLQEFTLTNGKLSATATAKAVHTFNYPGATPTISSDGNTDGIVWESEQGNPAILHAYDALSLKELYNSDMDGVRDEPTVSAVKFTPPTVANGKVYLPTNGSLAVYGLFPAAAKTPGVPTNFSVVATSSSTVALSFAAADDTETGFQVLRSTDGTNYSRVNTLPAGLTSYVDINLVPATTYYYRILAQNTAGNSGYTAVVSAKTFAQANLTGLVGYWRFDEANGGVATDSSVTKQNGNIVGEVTRVDGKVGPGGLSLHGTGVAPSEVQVLDKSTWNFTASQSFSVGMWINPTRLISKQVGVFAKSGDIAPGYGIYINAANQWQFAGPTPINGTAVTLGWHYVAIVQDAAAKSRYLYVDGKVVATGAAQDGSGKGDLWLGSARASSVYFPGIIDDVRIYNLALTASQVSANFLDNDPAAAVSVTVTANSDTQATVTWTQPTVTNTAAPIGFFVQMLTTSGAYTNVAQVNASTFSAVVSGLTSGSSVTFRILAYNSAGNTASEAATATLSTGGGGTTSPLSVVINHVNGKQKYVLGTLHNNFYPYVDRSTQIAGYDPTLSGGVLIRTADNDKSSTSASQLTFTVNQPVTVYVAYDAAATTLPAWLTDWTLTTISWTGRRVYSKTFTTGAITLGGNLQAPAVGPLENYSVVVSPLTPPAK